MIVPLLLLSLFIFFPLSKQSVSIIGTTYDLDKSGIRRQSDNDSIVILDPTNGSIIKKEVVGSEDGHAIQNSKEGCHYYLMIEKGLHKISCLSLKEEEEPFPYGLELTHMGYDESTKRFYAVVQMEENEVMVLFEGGGCDVITDFPNECAVQLGSNFYDQSTGLYYISCSNVTNTEDNKYLVVDVSAKKIAKTIVVKDLVDELFVDGDFLYGFGEKAVVKLDMKTPEIGFEKILEYQDIGLSNLYGSVYDKEKNLLYATFTDYEQQLYVVFDLSKGKYESFKVNDDFVHLLLVKTF